MEFASTEKTNPVEMKKGNTMSTKNSLSPTTEKYVEDIFNVE
jgi:hypothetical protein